jgi:hypothetical protein
MIENVKALVGGAIKAVMPTASNVVFKDAAAWAAARLPVILAQEITLGNEWYNNNGHFKFKAGDIISTNNRTFGLDAKGWRVVSVGRDGSEGWSGDVYFLSRISAPTRRRQRIIKSDPIGQKIEVHAKWNVENLFKRNKKYQPVPPNRGTSRTADNVMCFPGLGEGSA